MEVRFGFTLRRKEIAIPLSIYLFAKYVLRCHDILFCQLIKKSLFFFPLKDFHKFPSLVENFVTMADKILYSKE